MHFLHISVAFAGCPPNGEVQKFHTVSKILLMPSLMENAALVAMEAMKEAICPSSRPISASGQS
jgi:hypothetical protein